MKHIKLVSILSLTLLTLGACGASNQEGTDTNTKQETTSKESNNDNKKTVKDIKKTTFNTNDSKELKTNAYNIKITDHKVIPAGEEGNEYGKEAIIAFWYETTASKDEDESDNLTPMKAWMSSFIATQGKDKNLSIASLNDDSFDETQKETIKPGETIKGATAYKLINEETPVELTAQNISGETFGSLTFDVK